MERLAPELLSMILSHIGFEECLRLRLVNKFWMNVIDQVKVNRLVLIGNNRRVFNQLWFYSNVRNRLNDPDLLSLVYSGTVPEKFVKSNLSHLKQLFIDLSNFVFNDDWKDYLNQFKHLEELNIFGPNSLLKDLTIDLPKLRILSALFSEGSNIRLQTPLLTAFKCRFLWNYEIAYPESLVYLDADFGDLESVQQFVNLERLYCFDIGEYKPVLDKLPKLKEIHSQGYDIEILLRLDEERVLSGRSDLQLFSRGIELSDYRTNEIDLEMFGSEFYAQHYTKLVWTSNRPIDNLILNYGCRNDPWLKYHGMLPDDLFEKFIIIHLTVDNLPKNEKLFFQLISKCRNLNWVSFYSAPSEKLKRRLAELQPTITNLEFFKKTSVECILRFKYLMCLDLREQLNSGEVIPSVQRIFEQLHYIEDFYFHFASYSCHIKRVQSTHFKVELKQNNAPPEVERAEKTEENFESLQQVIDFLKPKIPVEPYLVEKSKSYLNKCTVQ